MIEVDNLYKKAPYKMGAFCVKLAVLYKCFEENLKQLYNSNYGRKAKQSRTGTLRFYINS